MSPIWTDADIDSDAGSAYFCLWPNPVVVQYLLEHDSSYNRCGQPSQASLHPTPTQDELER